MANETKLGGMQIAALSAYLTGSTPTRSRDINAATRRFLSIAEVRGLDGSRYLAAPGFDEALALLKADVTAKKIDRKAVIPADVTADQESARAAAVQARQKAEATKPQPPAPKAEKPAKAKPAGKRAAREDAARAGKLPTPPDFSAGTHKPYRNRLAEVVAMVKAGDLAGLKALEIKTYSSSPKAIARYRDLAVLALEARASRPGDAASVYAAKHNVPHAAAMVATNTD